VAIDGERDGDREDGRRRADARHDTASGVIAR
jgi:hypothetical protein